MELEERAHGHGIQFRSLALRSQFDLASIIGLRRLVRTLQPEVIHVHKGVAHAVALAATLRDRVGAFVVNRGVSFPLDVWNRGKYRTDRVDRVVTVCRQIKDVIVESGRLPPAKVDVIYAGTDINLFHPDKHDPKAFRREKGIPDDRFLITQVGIRDWKGWMELVDSLSDIVPRHPNAHVALIGCRSEEDLKMVRDFARTAVCRGTSPRSSIALTCRASLLHPISSSMPHGLVRGSPARFARPWPCASRSSPLTPEEPRAAFVTYVGWMIPMKDRAALSETLLTVIENPERAGPSRRTGGSTS